MRRGRLLRRLDAVRANLRRRSSASREDATPDVPPGVAEWVDPDSAGEDHFAPGWTPGRVRYLDRIYFDVETMGLAAGCRIFLAGYLWWERDDEGVPRLRLVQDVARDIVEEGRLVRRAAERLGAFPTIVTYNGSSFDVPHLGKRLRFHGGEWSRPPRVDDLLTRARRQYRKELGDCRLSTLEREVLGKRRRGLDVSGAQVPLRFLDYLETGNAVHLEPILYHNRIDLTSLVVLDDRLDPLDAPPTGAPECR